MRSRRHVGLTTAALLIALLPAALAAQVRPEVGLTAGHAAGLSGPALENLESDAGLGVEAGVELAGTWRLAVFHVSNTLPSRDFLVPDADLATTALEARAHLAPGWPVRPYAGWQVGVVRVDYDTSIFEAVLFVEGTEITPEDEGLLHGPTAGVRVPVGRHVAVDAGAAYRFLGLDPAVIGPGEDPRGSGDVALSLTLVGRL